MNNPLTRFKWVAFLEGTSFLILLFVCVPLKYGLGILWPNKVMGMAHGVLTVLYVFTLIDFSINYRIGALRVVQFLIASLLPFGTFYAEKKWIRPLEA
jgi:integral membrane protein